MEDEKKHWDSKVEMFRHSTLEDLQSKINAFCEGRFVVGIQYYQDAKDNSWIVVISYKVQQE